MTALWVLAIIAAILAALWFLPLRLYLRYDERGGSVRVKIGPVSVSVYPKRQKQPKEQRKKAQKGPEAEAPPEEAKKRDIGGLIPMFRELLALGIEALESLFRHLTVTDMTLTLAVATQGKDPAVAAIKYGSGWSAVGALIPVLEQHLIIRRRRLDVIMDTQATEDCIFASGTLHIFLGELLHLGLHYGIRGLKLYLRTKKKGGKHNGTSDQ